LLGCGAIRGMEWRRAGSGGKADPRKDTPGIDGGQLLSQRSQGAAREVISIVLGRWGFCASKGCSPFRTMGWRKGLTGGQTGLGHFTRWVN